MVMPCSRSAWSPSSSRLKSIFSPLTARLCEASVIAARWSSVTPAASHSSRPIRVDLPSSTEPQVSSLSNAPLCAAVRRGGLGLDFFFQCSHMHRFSP